MLWKCSVWTSAFMSKLAHRFCYQLAPRTFVGARLPANRPVHPLEMFRLLLSLRGQARSYGSWVWRRVREYRQISVGVSLLTKRS